MYSGKAKLVIWLCPKNIMDLQKDQASDLFLHSMKLCCRFLGTKEKEASPLDQTKETEEAEAD